MTPTGAQRAIDAVWRIESPRLIAGLARMVRDVGVAEDLAQDALVAALEQWPQSGVPANPGAWLMAIGKRRAIDRFRREDLRERKVEEFGLTLQLRADESAAEFDDAVDDDIGDDLLRLVFIACHPVLAQPARVALTLRLLGGLTTGEIARAFFVPEATVAQRIVRAKRTLTVAHVPFEVPRGADRTARLASVLEVLYLIFNEAYCATTGDDWLRPALCEDALRMGRVVAELIPSESEVHGLVALMEIQASRTAARTGRAAIRSCSSIRIARAGTTFSSAAALLPWSAPNVSAMAWGHTRCKRRSPPVMGARERRRRPTGFGSSRCMMHYCNSSRPRSSRLTAPSPSASRTDRQPGWKPLKSSVPSRLFRATTCSQASVVICSCGWVDMARVVPNSNAPHSSRTTRANVRFFSHAPGHKNPTASMSRDADSR